MEDLMLSCHFRGGWEMSSNLKHPNSEKKKIAWSVSQKFKRKGNYLGDEINV